MTFQEHVENTRIRYKEIAEHLGVSEQCFIRYHKRDKLHDLSIRQGMKLCDFVGISKQEFIKGNIKPLKGRR